MSTDLPPLRDICDLPESLHLFSYGKPDRRHGASPTQLPLNTLRVLSSYPTFRGPLSLHGRLDIQPSIKTLLLLCSVLLLLILLRTCSARDIFFLLSLCAV